MPAFFGYVRLGSRAALDPPAALAAMAAALPGPEAPRQARIVDRERGVCSQQLASTGEQDPAAGALLDGYILDGEALGRPGADGAAGAPEMAGDTDAARLRQLLLDDGLAGFAQVDGDYNLAVFGPGDRDLTLVGSRHGTRHLYYREGDGYLAFATHVGALARLPGPVSVDELALHEMFNFGYLGGERSLLRQVRLLPPGSGLRVSADGCALHRYWRPEYANTSPACASFDDLVDEAATCYAQAIDACTRRFPGAAVPLSGGLDSRTILAFAAREGRRLPVYHCSWYAREAAIARDLCRAAGAAWHEYDPLAFDFADILREGSATSEGSVHAHQFWFLPVARDLGRDPAIDVVLDGYLMDVFFGDTFLVLPPEGEVSAARKRDIINGIWRRCHPRFVRQVFRADFARDYEAANRASLDEQMGLVDDEHLSNYIQRFSLANRSNRYSVALPNVQRQHVEYAYPGLHRGLVDLYLRLPPPYKAGAAFSRAVLARHAPAFAEVPWAKTGRPLTQDKTAADRLADRLPLRQVASLALLRLSGGRLDLTHRADLNRHFRRHPAFRRAFLDIVDDERTFDRGWIDPAGLRRLVHLIDRGWPVFFLLQCLATVELFHRRVIDR